MAEDIAKAERPISLSEFGQHRSGALRHRYKVITLTPSARDSQNDRLWNGGGMLVWPPVSQPPRNDGSRSPPA